MRKKILLIQSVALVVCVFVSLISEEKSVENSKENKKMNLIHTPLNNIYYTIKNNP